MICGNDSASYKFISTEHKMSLETTISKKAYLNYEKSLWPIFPRNIENDKPQATFYHALSGILTTIEENIRSFP